MISVVCVYNNREILEEFLLKSLKTQSVEYELFLMDNRNGKFKSAAEALNEGGKKANGKYIMFVHQDIDLKSNNWLENVEKMLDSLDNVGIAGVAGRIKYRKGIVTTIEDGIPPQKIPSFNFKTPVKVQTLDECLFIIPKSIFNTLQFDEETCDDWHLYAVDYSLVAQKKGYDVYVIPIFLYHRSSGFSFSENYYITLEKLLKKHWKEWVVYTTMKNWITFYPVSVQMKFPFLKEKTLKILKKIKIN
ncbi:MAG: glycosyltransferase [Methanobacteriaceae archaeon]|jgi:GT2 family glycosyltransferase